jgi:hypothetical protein
VRRVGMNIEFGLVNRIIYHLQIVTTSNYSATANYHNSHIITAPAKPFTVCYVLTSCSLATASNSGHSTASRVQVFPAQRISRN